MHLTGGNQFPPWAPLGLWRGLDWARAKVFGRARRALAGGDNQIRTDDPLLAKQVLSQLSYTPIIPVRS